LFRELWKYYLFQSFLATIVFIIVMLVLRMQNVVVIASIGATAFIVFLMPKNISANHRRTIEDHIIGLISGSLAESIPHHTPLTNTLVYLSEQVVLRIAQSSEYIS